MAIDVAWTWQRQTADLLGSALPPSPEFIEDASCKISQMQEATKSFFSTTVLLSCLPACLLACLFEMFPFLPESPWWSPGTRLVSCWSPWAAETNNGTSWRTSPSGTCRTALCPLSCRRTLTSVYQTSNCSHSVRDSCWYTSLYRQSVTRMGPNTTETDTISARCDLICTTTGLFRL